MLNKPIENVSLKFHPLFSHNIFFQSKKAKKELLHQALVQALIFERFSTKWLPRLKQAEVNFYKSMSVCERSHLVIFSKHDRGILENKSNVSKRKNRQDLLYVNFNRLIDRPTQ